MAAHWLRAVAISGLAILYSEMAEAEQLRLECSIKEDCHRLNRGFTSCASTNPVVSLMVEIDLEANTWVVFGTLKDGTQTGGGSGNLKAVTQYQIILRERSYKDGRTERDTISRTSGAIDLTHYDVVQGGIPIVVTRSGTCNKTTKPLPSAKF